MAVKLIQLGQVWRKDEDGQDYLVTKLYNEVFTQYAVLRPAEVTAPDLPTVRVKVAKTSAGVALPGFTFSQEGSVSSLKSIQAAPIPNPHCLALSMDKSMPSFAYS